MAYDKVKKACLSHKFLELFSDDDEVLYTMKETPKAVLLKGIATESWVPKSCISEANAIDFDSMYSSQEKSIKFPIKHDTKHEYRDVLSLPLYQHQQDVVKTLKDSRHSYLGMEMGTGKTASSLAHIAIQKQKYPIQIICEKGLMSQWKSEIHKFAPDLEDRVRIINYDKIFRDSCKEYLSELKKNRYFLILEEVSCLGHIEAKRTQKSIELAKNAFDVQMLSGSFYGGKLEQFYPVFTIQGFTGSKEQFEDMFTIKIPSVKSVRTRYGYTKIKDERIIGYKNIDLMLKKSSESGAVYLKTEDCIDLPETVISSVYVALDRKAVKYEGAFYKLQNTIDDNEKRGMLAKIKHMNSCADNKNKLDAIEALLSKSSDRFVIMYSLVDELDALKRICKKANRKVSEWNGSVKDRTYFDKYDNSVMLVQWQSGAKGLNLQKANKMIFTSPISSDAYIQAKKRIHRIGQKRKCFYWLICSDDRFERNRYEQLFKSEERVNSIG
jgi:SNF2 family DNA or RNA helicase